MIYVVAYDIPEPYDNLRIKLSRILHDYGMDRLQKSVFIGVLSRNLVENMVIEIKELLKDIDADVRIFPLCKKCFENSINVLGGEVETGWIEQTTLVIV
ncbi:MAG: CRISPR-associated endonuclease Cas2 [Candidatus Asgardarchaeia archaeon]